MQLAVSGPFRAGEARGRIRRGGVAAQGYSRMRDNEDMDEQQVDSSGDPFSDDPYPMACSSCGMYFEWRPASGERSCPGCGSGVVTVDRNMTAWFGKDIGGHSYRFTCENCGRTRTIYRHGPEPQIKERICWTCRTDLASELRRYSGDE